MARTGGDSEQHDLLDDIISITKDWQAVQNPLSGVTDALTADPDSLPRFDPDDYKERPRANTARCVRCQEPAGASCAHCELVCPVDAITIAGGQIKIAESCQKCGLCVAACPTEALSDRSHMARRLYDEVAAQAAAHNSCYLTCARALGRLPEKNEIVLPCIGALSPELLMALLADFKNLSIYLPLGVCDECLTTTGELVYLHTIELAEAWSGRSLGLEMDEDALDHNYTRAYERTEFMKSAFRTGTQAASMANPVLTGAQAVANALRTHTRQLNSLEAELDRLVGVTTTQKKRRSLTQRRQVALVSIQKHPTLAERIEVRVPSWDSATCSACGDCVRICPFNVLDLDDAGRMSVAAAFCASCGACVDVCREGSLTWRRATPDELRVPDEDAARRAEQQAAQAAEIERLKAEGKARLERGLSALEKLADDDSEG